MTALLRDLANVPGVHRVRRLPVEVSVTFVQSPGVCETLEGPVHYDAGDAIVVGARGERWPVKRETFAKTYEPIEPITPMKDGMYRKIAGEVLALRLKEAECIELPGSRGVLAGRPGDWVLDYGRGDMGVVAADVFAATYKLLD
jgi:hypothetical protein